LSVRWEVGFESRIKAVDLAFLNPDCWGEISGGGALEVNLKAITTPGPVIPVTNARPQDLHLHTL